MEIIQFFSISFNRVLQQDSNREEELELEKSRAQRARRISEVLLCDVVREVAPRGGSSDGCGELYAARSRLYRKRAVARWVYPPALGGEAWICRVVRVFSRARR